MSDHWRPDEDVMRARTGGAERVRSPHAATPERRQKRERMPEGATPGLLFVTALSLAVGMGVYFAIGPGDVVAAGAERHFVDRGVR
jgi:hypothetical protein